MNSKKAKKNIFNAFVQLMLSAKAYTKILILAALGIIIARLADGAIYKYLLPQTLDKGFIAHDLVFLNYMPALIAGIFICLGIGEFLSKYCMGFVARSVVRDYRVKMLDHLLLVPVSYYTSNNNGAIISKINYDSEQVAIAVSDAIKEFLNSIIAIIVLFGIMLSISWQVTALILLIVPLIGGLLKLSGKAMRRYSVRVQKTMGHLTHVASELIHGHQVIRTYDGIDFERERLKEAVNHNRQQELKIFMVSAISSPIMQLIGGAVLIGFVTIITLGFIKLSPGDIFGLIGAMFALIRPLKQMTEVNNVFQKGIAAITSIHELLFVPAEVDHGKHFLARTNGNIKFENVSFQYPNEKKMVLSNVSFNVKAGETVALVGHSGGGKSSLINLLPRFYNITEGRIVIDNLDIQEILLQDLRRQFAIVSQNVFLFNATVADNIAYGGMRDASHQDIYAAAKSAYALDFIQELPEKFDTIIGDNGCLLSGGQKQRIAIARAILKNAPILILDEATSALDLESERKIQLALDKLMKTRTTLVIAHRLSTIEKADKILVLEKGRIVESGTHESLLCRAGRYQEMATIP